jgi:hypothetical protein
MIKPASQIPTTGTGREAARGVKPGIVEAGDDGGIGIGRIAQGRNDAG